MGELRDCSGADAHILFFPTMIDANRFSFFLALLFFPEVLMLMMLQFRQQNRTTS